MIVDYRRFLMPAGVAAVGLVAIAIFWLAVQSSVRHGLWQTVAQRQPAKSEFRRLDDCKSVGWWTWLKVLSQNRAVRCGEVWAAEELADKVRGADRVTWLSEWVTSPQSKPLLKLRASLALTLAGKPTPAEPAWLSLDPNLPDWPGPGLAAAVAQDRAWGVHLGPRWMALGRVWALSESGLGPSDALLPLEALWAIEDESVASQAARAAARGMSVPPDLPDDVRYRRSRGLPPGNLPSGWAEAILSRPDCPSPCLELWIDLLRLDAEAEALDPWEYPETTPILEPLASQIGFTGWRMRALEWWTRAAVQWVAASPDPAARLATLAEGGPDGSADPLRVYWDRTAAPFTTAVVVMEVGRRASLPVDVRIDEGGAMWIDVGGRRVVRRGCARPAGTEPPEGGGWDRLSLIAGALAEAAADAVARGEHLNAVRLATAAERMDPILAHGLPTRMAEGIQLSEDALRGHAAGAGFVVDGWRGPSVAAEAREAAAPLVGVRCGNG
ncbi:MAG: hypothetical protein KTR31_03375 [Myxococcales bacterium]|nr:hypothetical protein [Myxococcales bacterium]